MDAKKIDALLQKREQKRVQKKRATKNNRTIVLREVRVLNKVLKARLGPRERIEIDDLILTCDGVRLRRYHMSYKIDSKMKPALLTELADRWDELEHAVIRALKRAAGEAK